MEFNEKLQELRRQRGLTQEELAAALFVSRTAVSKWELGRGYPSIDSLREIAKFFSLSVDELLSSEKILCIAEEDSNKKQSRFIDLILGLLDISVVALCFFPFFAQKSGEIIREVSLLSLNSVSSYLVTVYFVFVFVLVLWGVLTLALQNFAAPFWATIKTKVSVILSLFATIVFTVSLQPYAAVFLLLFLIIKVLVLIKK